MFAGFTPRRLDCLGQEISVLCLKLRMYLWIKKSSHNRATDLLFGNVADIIKPMVQLGREPTHNAQTWFNLRVGQILESKVANSRAGA